MKSKLVLLMISAWLWGWTPLVAGAAGPGERPLRELSALTVNTSMDHRVLVRKSQAAGVADLRRLLPSARVEEVWAFVPGPNLWVEVGCCERETALGTYVAIDTYLLELFARHAHLVIYHIQPPTAFVAENYSPRRRRLARLAEALPSAQDLATVFKVEPLFWARQPAGRLEWKICSRLGVTSYGVSKEALSGPRPDLKAFDQSPWAEEPDEFGDFPEESLSDVQLVAQVCRRLSRAPFRVEFRPHE